MPSPLGHILGGATVYLAGTRKEERHAVTLGLTLFGGIAPDFDFLPGMWIGSFSAFHHGISHSLTSALLFGLIVFIPLKWVQVDVAGRASVLAAISYAVHVFLDFAGANEGTRGVPVFWPVFDRRFGLDLDLLGHFYYTNKGLWSVMRWDNVPALVRELLIIGSPVLILLWKERWGSDDNGGWKKLFPRQLGLWRR